MIVTIVIIIIIIVTWGEEGTASHQSRWESVKARRACRANNIYKQLAYNLSKLEEVDKYQVIHSGIYGHNNETLIFQNFAFNMQFYTYLNPYDMN